MPPAPVPTLHPVCHPRQSAMERRALAAFWAVRALLLTIPVVLWTLLALCPSSGTAQGSHRGPGSLPALG